MERDEKMSKKIKISIIVLIVLVVIVSAITIVNTNTNELKSIRSAKQLEQIYNGKTSTLKQILMYWAVAPIILPDLLFSNLSFDVTDQVQENQSYTNSSLGEITAAGDIISSLETDTSSTTTASTSKDYSTTNVQVENVDEADITKTDGDYIYSISDDKVIITNVMDPTDIKIAATITAGSNEYPEDLILYNDTLVVILVEYSGSYYSSSKANTVVKVYNIEDRENPRLAKNYQLYEPYYTSRCIDNKLYVISSGTLRMDDDYKEVITYYDEDNKQKNIPYDDIKYLKDVNTKKQTLISMLDLDNLNNDVNVSSYLIDISNAYVSENNIYLLNQKYEGGDYTPSISSLFGLKGVFGIFDYDDYTSGTYKTEIYKFNILEDGTIEYDCKNKVAGKTINQYSVDEYNDNLRVALYNNDGTRVVIFNEDMEIIGESEYLAKGEQMYSSRFMGNKVYLVTYMNKDPLFVVDLTDPTNPETLGELKIPGYSTYLHPYDENHIIGIGMETQETVNRNSSGKVISETIKTVGMKMALFDVSDVNNPIQISNTIIGDSRTTSAILTNPKALLFSREKELIAIPVNNYAEDFEVTASDYYSSSISAYTSYSKSRIAEGYFVYKINLEEGFSLKGVITHDVTTTKSYYTTSSKLLRGLYIDDNLYTVSETAIKVNDLETLNPISELKIK